MNTYSPEFYQNRHQKTLYSAQTILSILLKQIPKINSAVDIGCGVGTWLSVLQNKGVKQIQGIDGDWVDPEFLVIPKDCFQQADLSQMIKPSQNYDLAISLEVAEHLAPDCAEDFVSMLTELSDYILFSAAIPGQGGINHVNEQWQDYWVNLFNNLNYEVHDLIRPAIWQDDRIPFWYRQNILLFSRQDKSPNITSYSGNVNTNELMLNAIHPNLYQQKRKAIQKQQETLHGNIGVKHSIKLFFSSWKYYIKRKFGQNQNN